MQKNRLGNFPTRFIIEPFFFLLFILIQNLQLLLQGIERDDAGTVLTKLN